MHQEGGVIVTTKRRDHRVEITAIGELDMDAESRIAGQLLAEIPEGPDAGPFTMLLDLRGVSFIDSSGLGMLVRGRRRVMSAEGRFVLIADLSGPVATMLRVTGLLNVFEVHGCLEDVLP